MKKVLKSKTGITLIALVVTIVVLLILAGISIAALGGENGLINQSKLAKEETEISEEKELLGRVTIQVAGKDVYGNIEEEALQKELDKEAGEGKTEVTDIGEEFEVIFKESNRYYIVDKDGNVGDVQEIIEDKNPGDITKDKDGNELDGSEEKPYEIWCIEDLVALSIMTNGGNSELGIEWNNFLGKNVELMRTLDFKSIFSYNDYTTKKYGDLNQDGKIEEIRTELTKTEEECIGFTPIGKKAREFYGIFDGKNNEIKNIYQNAKTGVVALFGYAYRGEIKNLTLTGEIINKTWHAGGIMAEGTSNVTNCKNYTDVTGYNMVGGICAYSSTGITIENCENYGTINILGNSYQYCGAGGITGNAGTNGIIQNCVNEGNVIGTTTRAGIVGNAGSGGSTIKIYNCINKGNSHSGICSWVANGTVEIVNCYNLGKCENGIIGNYRGASWENNLELTIENSYNLGDVTNSGIVGAQQTICKTITLNIENCYSAGKCKSAIIGNIERNAGTTTVTNIKNTYYDNSKILNVGAIEEGITGVSIKNNEEFVNILNNNIGENIEWMHWKLGEDGYPTF